MRVRRRLVVVGAMSFVALFVLLGADVTAPTSDPSREDCGSPIEVLRRGSGFGGGELRNDQQRFDRLCVERARTQVRLAELAGLVLATTVMLGVLGSSRERHPQHDLRPNHHQTP